MPIPANVLPFELRRSRALPDVDANAVAEQCRQASLKHLELAIQRVLDNVDDALFALADKSEGGTVQNGYFDAMRDIRLKRESIKQEYAASFLRVYQDTLSSTVRTGKDGLQNLSADGLGFSLVGEQEMEELVAVDNLVAKTRDRFRDALFGLEQRYGALLGRSEPDCNANPLDPRALCQAFRDALAKVDAEIKIKLIIYKLFDQYVMWNLGALYDEVNALLAKAGVLPQIKRVVRKNEGSASPRRSPAEDGLDHGLDHGLDMPALGPNLPTDTFDRLQHLAGLYRASHGTAAYGPMYGAPRMDGAVMGIPAAGPTYSVDDMLNAFTRIQYDGATSTDAGGFLSREALIAALRSDGTDGGKQLAPVHDNTIDVVEMLFDFVLEDPNLPEMMKGLICRLQIPIIKIALLDSEFFSRKQHPARRMLNELAYAGAAWVDLIPTEQDSLEEVVRRVVDRVLREFDRDVTVFESALNDLLSALASARAQQESERQGRHAEAIAHRAATGAIIAAVGERAVPAVVAQYLSETWGRVLRRIALTEGVDGAAWQERCAIMERLLWSVEPKRTREEKTQLVRMLPDLITELRADMEALGSVNTEIDAAIGELENCHLAIIRGANEPAALTSDPSGDTAGADIDIAAWIKTMREDLAEVADVDPEYDVAPAVAHSGPASDYPTLDDIVRASGSGTSPTVAEDDPHVQTIRAMPLGTWVEFVLADKVRRGKLAWKDNDYGEYLFVDRRYKVVADKGIVELAADFAEGRVSIVEDVAFLDRALDAVMNRLMGAVAH